MIELNKKTQQDFFPQLIQRLEDIGFKDITEEYPIHFNEQIPTTFENIYTLQKRLERTNNDVITEILIGKEYNQVHIIGTSVYRECSSKFFLQELKDYALQTLIHYIAVNESKVVTYQNQYDRIKQKDTARLSQ